MDGAVNFRQFLAPVPSAPAHAAPDVGAPASRTPFAGWPAKDDLDYLKTLIELLVLLLAVPWLVKRLGRNPKEASRRAASKVGG